MVVEHKGLGKIIGAVLQLLAVDTTGAKDEAFETVASVCIQLVEVVNNPWDVNLCIILLQTERHVQAMHQFNRIRKKLTPLPMAVMDVIRELPTRLLLADMDHGRLESHE